MKRTAGLLLLLAAAAMPQDDRDVAEFRLKQDPSATLHGWILEHDNDGFVFETFGRERRVTVKWADLVDEDARRLRIGYKLDLTEDEEKGLIPGQELQLRLLVGFHEEAFGAPGDDVG